MTRTDQCSTPETLRLYISGKLSPEESEAIDRHLEHCESCLALVEQFELRATGTLNRQLRGMPSLNDSLILHGADDQTDAADPQLDEIEIPENIGAYKILRVLGLGGMGIVYEAEQPNLKRRVAIKVVKPKHRLDADMLGRFQRELDAVSRLEHTNIVRAYDAGAVDDQPYLVMELLEGTDLGAFVLQRPPLSLENVIKLGRQAVAGLQYAHQAGFVHRDIKPSNLFLTKSGVLKLLDFGLAKPYENTPSDDDHTPGRTQSGMIVGTCDYIAPEQIEQSAKVDHRADIYSLGCTLFYLLTKQPPHKGSQANVLASHLRDPFPSIRETRPDLPESVGRLLQRMTAKKPEDRPDSVREVANALLDIRRELEGNNIAPPPIPEIPYKAPPLPPPSTISNASPLESTVVQPPPITNLPKPTTWKYLVAIALLACIVVSFALGRRFSVRSLSDDISEIAAAPVEPKSEPLPIEPEKSKEESTPEPVKPIVELSDPFEDAPAPKTVAEKIDQSDKPKPVTPVVQYITETKNTPAPATPSPKPQEKKAVSVAPAPKKPVVVDPKDDPRNKPKNDRFWNKSMSGKVSFDYESNNGCYAIGEGEYMFETNWTNREADSIYAYKRTKSITGVANAPGLSHPRQIRQASKLDYSNGTVN